MLHKHLAIHKGIINRFGSHCTQNCMQTLSDAPILGLRSTCMYCRQGLSVICSCYSCFMHRRTRYVGIMVRDFALSLSLPSRWMSFVASIKISASFMSPMTINILYGTHLLPDCSINPLDYVPYLLSFTFSGAFSSSRLLRNMLFMLTFVLMFLTLTPH